MIIIAISTTTKETDCSTVQSCTVGHKTHKYNHENVSIGATMKLKKVLVVYMQDPYTEHYVCLKKVRNVLKKYRINHEMIQRDCLCMKKISGKDLVITVGGDGTVLSTSHKLRDTTPILGVNSNPQIKEGFLCRANAKNFESVLKRILSGNFRIVRLSRLVAVFRNRKLTPALNEVFVGNRKPYFTALYDIEIRGSKEFQKSSGVIVCTPTGSNSWCKSAGGKKLPSNYNGFELIVREPYRGKLFQPKLTKMLLKPKEVIKITSRFKDNIVVIDSIKEEHCLAPGETVKIMLSSTPLYFINA
ncbi:NAD(+)/NADH kinase [Candidatus Woesearchaeota archaeon]|nr:NAD(+)/NADH kinase [Candidatus Woesearchaeota archaeon]